MKDLPRHPRKNNKTGINGVSITRYSYHCYIANDKGRRISKKFSLAKHGRYEAMRKAIQWRRERELEFHGYSVIPEECVAKGSEHRQSEREAENIQLLKKAAAREHRERQSKAFADTKNRLQKNAGKYIYRIDDLDLGHGWLLKVELQGEKIYEHVFRDNQYGSVEEALKTALNERERQLEKHNIPYNRGRRFSNSLRSTNVTGVTGVCRSGLYYHCYIPIKPNRRKTKKISINKHGESLAFEMALEWRQEMEIHVYGQSVISKALIEELVAAKREN